MLSFWCAGCHGSLYPYVGHVAHHIGGIQASHLLTHRLIAKLHSIGMLWAYKEKDFCKRHFTPRIKKSAYKTQLVHPVSDTKGPCNPLGKSEIFWGAGKSFPYKGEDFVYLIWTKKQCCLRCCQTGNQSNHRHQRSQKLIIYSSDLNLENF